MAYEAHGINREMFKDGFMSLLRDGHNDMVADALEYYGSDVLCWLKETPRDFLDAAILGAWKSHQADAIKCLIDFSPECKRAIDTKVIEKHNKRLQEYAIQYHLSLDDFVKQSPSAARDLLTKECFKRWIDSYKFLFLSSNASYYNLNAT